MNKVKQIRYPGHRNTTSYNTELATKTQSLSLLSPKHSALTREAITPTPMQYPVKSLIQRATAPQSIAHNDKDHGKTCACLPGPNQTERALWQPPF